MEFEDIRAFVPALDYKLSRQFYLDLGMTIDWDTGTLCCFLAGDCSFLLQDFYVKEFAENCMLQLCVTDIDAAWRHIQTLDLRGKYPGVKVSPPKTEAWGKVIYLHGPAGELWHITEEEK